MQSTLIVLTVALAWAEPRTAALSAAPRAAQIIVKEDVQVTPIDRVQVAANVAGLLTSLDVREGQMVKAGENIGRVEDGAAKIAQGKAALEVKIAAAKSENDVSLLFSKKAWEVAKTELKRAEESIAKYRKAISETEMDQKRLTAEKCELEIEQARRELGIAKLTKDLKQNELDAATFEVARRQIIAPIDGIVVQLNKHEGEWANPGDPVLRILRIDRLRVEFYMSADEFGPELNGCAVKLSVDLPKQRREHFAGHIVFVSPEVQPVNSQFRVWAEVENRDLLLRPGVHGSLEIDLNSAPAKTAKTP